MRENFDRVYGSVVAEEAGSAHEKATEGTLVACRSA